MKSGRRFTDNNNIRSGKSRGQRFADDSYGHNADGVFDDDYVSDFDVNSETFTQKELRSNSHSDISVKDKRKKIKQEKKNRNKNAKKSSGKRSFKEAFDSYSSKNRKTLSYEDLPLEERENGGLARFSKTVRLNKKNIILLAAIVVILVLVVLGVTNSDKLSFSNIKNWVEYGVLDMDSEEKFPVDIQGSTITAGNFTRYGSDLIYSSDTQFVTMNSYGKTIYSYQQSLSNPVLVTANDSDLSVVYNLGGTKFNINSLEKTVYSGTAEGNIIVADIAKNGTYALVTQSNGYLSKLYVYSSDNKQIFAYSFADYYITAVAIDPTGSKAALSGVAAHNGSEFCAVYVLDFTEKEPAVFKEFQDNIIYDVSFLNSKYVSIVGRTAIYGLNTKSGDFTTTEYDGRTLTAYYVNTDTDTLCVSLSRSGDTRNCDILYFSSSVELEQTIETDLRISSISTYKNRIAVLSYSDIYLYNNTGSLISTTSTAIDPKSIVLYSKSDAYVLGISEISRISL